MQVPETPKTTFTVSLANGGQAIHGIAQSANFKINMRSDSAEVLAQMEQQALAIFQQGADAENARWQKPGAVKSWTSPPAANPKTAVWSRRPSWQP
jgi:tripeptide aminopeptidase